jgi:hypothetical protein
MVCNVSYLLNLHPFYFTHPDCNAATGTQNLLCWQCSTPGSVSSRSNNKYFIAVADPNICCYNTGNEHVTFRNKIVNMDAVPIRDKIPAIKRGSE